MSLEIVITLSKDTNIIDAQDWVDRAFKEGGVDAGGARIDINWVELVDTAINKDW